MNITNPQTLAEKVAAAWERLNTPEPRRCRDCNQADGENGTVLGDGCDYCATCGRRDQAPEQVGAYNLRRDHY